MDGMDAVDRRRWMRVALASLAWIASVGPLEARAADAASKSSSSSETGRRSEAGKLHRERIEWLDVWHTDADKSDRPRILLIGDSIARGYFGGVESALADRVYCSRLTTSRSVVDPVFFQEIELVLGQYSYAAIHFNNGLHGWGHTEAEYAEGLGRMTSILRENAPGARLVWATTTPVRADGSMGGERDRVAARNAIAAELVAKAGIPVNDLHAIAAAHPDHLAGDGVHFTDAGRAAQAEAVARAIRDELDSATGTDGAAGGSKD